MTNPIIGVPRQHVDRHSAGLIDDIEWNLFYNGPDNYYAHIVSLFERQKAFSYVLDFASLALRFVNPVEAGAIGNKTELLSRMFSAATALSRYDVAHSTLLSMTDRALQHASLRKLIEKMCEASQNAELVTLTYGTIVAQLCKDFDSDYVEVNKYKEYGKAKAHQAHACHGPLGPRIMLEIRQNASSPPHKAPPSHFSTP